MDSYLTLESGSHITILPGPVDSSQTLLLTTSRVTKYILPGKKVTSRKVREWPKQSHKDLLLCANSPKTKDRWMEAYTSCREFHPTARQDMEPIPHAGNFTPQPDRSCR